jgi:hypothetical protein
MLPTKKTERKTDLRDLTIMIYGLPKIGKSTTCARLEGALFIPTEPGHNALEIFATPLVESWDQFLGICNDLATQKHQFKTIIVDMFDHLYELCAKWVCKKHNKEHEGDIGYGKGASMIRYEVKRVVTKLASLDSGLVLVSHVAEQENESRTGIVVRKSVPAFSSKVWGGKSAEAYHADFIGLVDAILFATIDKDKDGNLIRVVKSAPQQEYEAGDRSGMFKDNMLLSDLFINTTTKGGK